MTNLIDMEYDMIEIALDTGCDYEFINNFCYICTERLGYGWEKTKELVRRSVTL